MFEWDEFKRIQPLTRQIYDRQATMGIDICIAVSWEMFRRRDHLLTLDSLGERGAKSSHIVRIFAKAAHVNHRICGIVIDV